MLRASIPLGRRTMNGWVVILGLTVAVLINVICLFGYL